MVTKARNIHFRQSSKNFGSDRQTAIFSHIKRNIPYHMITFSKKIFTANVRKLKEFKNNSLMLFRLPKYAKLIK